MKKMKGYIDWFMVWAAVTISLGIVVGIPIGLYQMDKAQCHSKSQMMGLESNFGFMTGCMVKVGDRYFPRDSIRLVNGELVVDMAD